MGNPLNVSPCTLNIQVKPTLRNCSAIERHGKERLSLRAMKCMQAYPACKKWCYFWLVNGMLIVQAVGSGSNAADPEASTCQPKGLLKLTKPYLPPQRVPPSSYVCSKYANCTCCTSSTLRLITQYIALLSSEDSVTSDCLDWTNRMLCLHCNAEFGVHQSPPVCTDACMSWYAACRSAFFALHQGMSPSIRPCDAPGSPMVCARLDEMAADGAQLCSMMGFEAIGLDPAGPFPVRPSFKSTTEDATLGAFAAEPVEPRAADSSDASVLGDGMYSSADSSMCFHPHMPNDGARCAHLPPLSQHAQYGRLVRSAGQSQSVVVSAVLLVVSCIIMVALFFSFVPQAWAQQLFDHCAHIAQAMLGARHSSVADTGEKSAQQHAAAAAELRLQQQRPSPQQQPQRRRR